MLDTKHYFHYDKSEKTKQGYLCRSVTNSLDGSGEIAVANFSSPRRIKRSGMEIIMRNPNIARVLRYYRKLNHLSVKEVSNYLKSKNIKIEAKSIYGWEGGRTQPNADTFMTLCNYYHIDNILETFGYSIENNFDIPLLLSGEERLVIEAYRQHPAMQDAVRKLLEISD